VGYAIGRWGGRVAPEQAQGQLASASSVSRIFSKQRGGLVILASAISRRAKASLNGIVAGCPANAPGGPSRRNNVAGRDSLDVQLGSRNLFLGFGTSIFIAAFFHRHSRLLYVLSVIAFCCFADVHAALEKRTQ